MIPPQKRLFNPEPFTTFKMFKADSNQSQQGHTSSNKAVGQADHTSPTSPMTESVIPSASSGGVYRITRFRDATSSDILGVCHVNLDLNLLDMLIKHRIEQVEDVFKTMSRKDKEELFNAIPNYSDLLQNLHHDEAVVHFWFRGEQVAWVGFGDRRCRQCREDGKPYCRLNLVPIAGTVWRQPVCLHCHHKSDFSCSTTVNVSDPIVQLYKKYFKPYFQLREKCRKDMETVGANLCQLNRWEATLKTTKSNVYMSEQGPEKGAAAGADRAAPEPSDRAQSEPQIHIKAEPIDLTDSHQARNGDGRFVKAETGVPH